MHERSPTLQFVMAVAVKEIGSPDGSAGAGCFNDAKSRVIVHDIIRKKDFLPAAPPHVQSRKIIQRACRSSPREQPAILFVPEAVFRYAIAGWRLGHRINDIGISRRCLRRAFLRVDLARAEKDDKEWLSEQ